MNDLLALASALSIRAGDTPEQVDARVQRALDALESSATPALPAPVNVGTAERDAGREDA